MQKLLIHGGADLSGEIAIDGAKNSIVALIPAAVLCRDKVRIYNYPNISDVSILIEILKDLNVSVEINKGYIEIDSTQIKSASLVSDKMTKLRASYYFMGVLISLFNEANVSLPGGCYLGHRPINLHLKGFEKLGCEHKKDDGKLSIKTEKLKGNKIFLDIASVGATINIMFASIFAEGETIIENAAKEPEIVDVSNFLNKMGAKITGAGTSVIKITGVQQLTGVDHRVIPDRIEAGTYLLIGAAIGKNLVIKNVNSEHLEALIAKLIESGVNIIIEKDKIIVSRPEIINPTNIRTSVYPGFPTDLQQIMTAFLTQAEGTSIVNETIYDARFKNCEDLNKMGANIRVENTSAIIVGPAKLTGTVVEASDLRGGASLVLAGLIASGETIIEEAQHIFRGYGDIASKLKNVNAQIKVIEN